MAKLEWPPEKTFKYVFDKNLELEIPVADTIIEKGGDYREER